MDYRYRNDEEVKDSGIEWIGKIPYNWIKSKIKYTSRDEYKSFTDGDWIESPYICDSGVRLIQTGNIGIGIYKEQGYRYISEKTFENLNCTEIKPNDVLICRLAAPVGRACLAPNINEKMVTSVDVCILKTNRFIDNRYIVYYLSCKGHIETAEMIARGGTRQRISRTQLGDMSFILPTLEEQKKIAKFLDEKTVQFDSIISKKEALIEKLEEAKKSLISEVVTGKVKVVKTSDGYELVERKKDEMKDSGVEWLGDIPKEWEVKKIKYISVLRSGDNITAERIEEEGIYPVYGGNGLRGYTNKYTHEGNYILIGRQGALCGNINYAYDKFWASEHAVVVNPILKVEILWLGELLRSMNLNQYSVSAAQPGLSVGMIENLRVPFVSLDEQKIISQFINKKNIEIDFVINKTKEQVEKLKEAKQSLISEAVTGKIEIL